MKKVLIFLSCILLLLSYLGKVEANPIILDYSFDLEKDMNYGHIGGVAGNRAWEGTIAIDSLSFQEGNEYLVRIRFDNNQALQLFEWGDADDGELTKLSFLFEEPSQNTWEASGVFTFLGTGGELLANEWDFRVSGGGGAVRTPFTTRNLTDSSFYYTGIDILMNFERYELTSGPGIFNRIEFSSGADDVKIIESAPIPEPATILLLGIGIIGLESFSRKKLKK